jgi:hypothetical protein
MDFVVELPEDPAVVLVMLEPLEGTVVQQPPPQVVLVLPAVAE